MISESSNTDSIAKPPLPIDATEDEKMHLRQADEKVGSVPSY